MSTTVNRLATIGYTEPDARARIDEFLQDENAALVDIRLNPRSRWQPAFNKSALEKRYPAQYIHVEALGNVNYKDRERGIDLLDAKPGIRQLLQLIEYGRSLMLMCACKDYERCHRKTVYELIMAERFAHEKATWFTVVLDPITKRYMARWLLPRNADAQWYHERSMDGPSTVEDAQRDVLRSVADAHYVEIDTFAAFLDLAREQPDRE